MSQTSIERLRDYLAQLPPQSQALLMREFERAIERGEDTAVATFVLEQLRKVVRGTEEDDEARPRTDDPARLLFRPLEPFLVEGNFPIRPGQIRRASLLPVWQWLTRDGAPEQARAFEAALAEIGQTRSDAGTRSRGPQIPARRGRGDRQDRRRRCPAATGSVRSPASVRPTSSRICCRSASVLQAREALDTLSGRLPEPLPGVRGIRRSPRSAPSLNVPSLQTPQAAAVRAVAGHAAADGAMADHPPRHQDGGVRR